MRGWLWNWRTRRGRRRHATGRLCWMTGLLAVRRRRCEARRTTLVKTIVCNCGLMRIGRWMWGQLRTMADGCGLCLCVGDVPQSLAVDVNYPHKFTQKRSTIYVSQVLSSFGKCGWSAPQPALRARKRYRRIENDTSRPPSCFNLKLTWTCTHSEQCCELRTYTA